MLQKTVVNIKVSVYIFRRTPKGYTMAGRPKKPEPTPKQVNVRLTDAQFKKLEAIRARQTFKTSINAIAASLLITALDGHAR
jgi:hypothetical protein